MSQQILTIDITGDNSDLKKSIQESTRLLREFKKTAESTTFKSTMEAERLESAKLTNSLKATRLESAQLALEKRKATQATQAAAGSYKEAQQRLTALGKSIREAKDSFTNMTPEIRKQITEYNTLNTKLKDFDKTMGNNYRNVGNYGSALSGAIPAIGQFTTLAGAGIAVASAVKSAYDTISNFDSGLKNVEKTTGLTRVQAQKLGDDFVELSRKMQTTSAVQLTEYATIAGQLGVKGTKDILSFTEALAKLETATNISGEEGGIEIARTLTLLDGGVQNVKKFGDEIVNLGNNFAATEKEILSNAESISQNVGIYKIGRQDVLAFATATKAVGIEAELVGSTFNRTLAVFEKTIRTGDGLQSVLKLIGGTESELARRFKEDASGVLVDFIGSLNKIDKAGGSVNEQLENLGITAVRDQRVIQSLATGGYDVLTKAIDTVRNSVGSLDAEHTTSSQKIENQVGRMSIAWQNFVLSVDKGEGVIGGSIRGISGLFANMLDALTDLNKGSDTFLGKLEGFSAFSPISMIERGISKGREREDLNSRGQNKQLNDIISLSSKWVDTTKEYLSISDQITLNQAKQSAQARINNSVKDAELAKEKARLAELEKSKSKTKGKTQAEIIKESKDSLGGGQVDNLRGIDKELAKIDLKWSKISEKIDLITDSKLKDQLTQQIKLGKELDKSILSLDTFAKAKDLKGVSGKGTSLSGTLNTNLPSSEGLLNSNAGYRSRFKNDAVIESESFSKEFTKSLRKNFAQSLTGFFDDLSSISQNTYDIEQRYNKLRADASADQIQALNKMEKLEKRINNGFTSILTNAFNSLSRIGSTAITTSISTGLSGGGWGDLTKMFKGENKAAGYGAVGSLVGSAVSGLSKPTSSGGQIIGGILSGAGTGAALGSVVPIIGTAIGAVGGAIIGAISGIFKSNAAKRQRELQELELKEQQKQTALQQRIAQLSYQSSIIGQMTNQGTVQGFDRDAFGNIVGRIDGKDILLVTERAKNMGS